MSNPFPKKKNGALSTSKPGDLAAASTITTTTNNINNNNNNNNNNYTATAPQQPRQIRFVSSDGQPQTKRRRVTAACRTCRKRKIRCSGEQPVCKTCTDYGHTCLGYNDPDKADRPFSQAPARDEPAVPADADDDDLPRSSPNTPRVSVSKAQQDTAKSPNPPKPAAVLPLTKDTLIKATKENEKLGVIDSPESSRTSLSSIHRTHVPYFRYFGPTAIVPGFKQMVVRVRDGRKGNPSQSSGSVPSLLSPQLDAPRPSLAAALADGESNNIPFYDRDDNLPTSNLVTHLCDLFFVHLACSFPFLQRRRFMKDLKEKRVDTILVDAVCALAARFSPHPLLSPPRARPIDEDDNPPDVKQSNNGQPFAHRAMTAVVDALSCPTLSVVQACLLLAYEEFGSNHDSGLWMYLGIAIRMAQDLGMQKLQGLKHNYGRTGLRPKAVIIGEAGKLSLEQSESPQTAKGSESTENTDECGRAMERERVDTFWSIFFLDRVISSGTGRPVTLRDEDIELRFPLQSESILPNRWPAPFPPLIRIIHLYGRATDLINAIQEDNHVDAETLKRLSGMESDLTGIYQRLSPKLHFNTMNFQTYVKAQEGTNFILLHFWFHTLIVLLHQPTLLNSFGGRIQQLYPNSRELSMSSAKTIADILSFSELIDAKSFIGNPFTSQPIYIAACAFLMESAYYSSPSSRSGSPGVLVTDQTSAFTMPNVDTSTASERKTTTKHSLLASAAKENYQRCYRALQSLQTYWEGTKYILTVLDQKAKGIGDPLLYTTEEMQSTTEIQLGQPLSSPNWQPPANRRASLDPASQKLEGNQSVASIDAGSPRMDPSQAIGWALTGETNSSQPNLSLLYQLPAPQIGEESESHMPGQGPASHSGASYSQTLPAYSSSASAGQANIPAPVPKYQPSNEAAMLSANPYTPSGPATTTGAQAIYSQNLAPSQLAPYGYTAQGSTSSQPISNNLHMAGPPMSQQFSDMFIESQDIDMTSFHNQEAFPFTFSSDFNPWLEYLPPDVINYFGDPTQNYGTTTLMSPANGDEQQPQSRPRQR